MNYANIKTNDVANGTGIRVSLFVSGCTHHCKGCFQPETWDFCYGNLFTQETSDYIMEKLKSPYCSGLTILGGDPMELQNQEEVAKLLARVKEELPEKTTWLYTGDVFETFLPGGKKCSEVSDKILSHLDVMVDGPFVEELKDISLIFRGSSNQRILDVKKSVETGQATDFAL